MNPTLNLKFKKKRSKKSVQNSHLISQSLFGKGTRLVDFVAQDEQWNSTQWWFAQKVMELAFWNAEVVMVCSINNVTAEKHQVKRISRSVTKSDLMLPSDFIRILTQLFRKAPKINKVKPILENNTSYWYLKLLLLLLLVITWTLHARQGKVW